MTPFLIAASIGAPLFAVWVVIDYQRALREVVRVTPGNDASDGQDMQAIQ
jgi:hypothetical protein